MANSVTARFNDNCKVFVSMSDDTTVEKAVIIDAEGNETDIGGGGGSSDFSTATVTLNITPPEGVTIVEEAVNTIFDLNDQRYESPDCKADNHIATILINTKNSEPAEITNVFVLDDQDAESSTLSNVETSGDITYNSDSQHFIVFGNGTITADVVF